MLYYIFNKVINKIITLDHFLSLKIKVRYRNGVEKIILADRQQIALLNQINKTKEQKLKKRETFTEVHLHEEK